MKIFFVGGGTFGHVAPVLPLIAELIKEHEITLITTPNLAVLPEVACFTKMRIIEVTMKGLQRKITLQNMRLLKQLWTVRRQFLRQFAKEKPDLVIGMGGYLSGIIIHVAIKLKIKTIIHEQNQILGLANKLVYRRVTFALSAFPLTQKGFIEVGNPRSAAASLLCKPTPYFFKRLLFVAGSLGAKMINELAIAFLNNPISREYTTTLITGISYYNKVKEQLPGASHYEILSFTNEPLRLMSEADIIVTRGGATTIFEIVGLCKPAIIIPSPNVVSNHQWHNANYLFKQECALMVDEADLNIDVFLSTLASLNAEKRENIRQNLKKLNGAEATNRFLSKIYEALNATTNY